MRSCLPHTEFRPGLPIAAAAQQSPSLEVLLDRMDQLFDRLVQIETALALFAEQRAVKDWYSTGEVASLLGKAEFTVREWCRLRRVHAKKRPCGRGLTQEWIISHAELQRIQNEGLLPVPGEY